MHFVDRTLAQNVPDIELVQLLADEKPKWLEYKSGNKQNKPSSKWTRDSIRDPLTVLFMNNCAYCGAYSDKNHDGEVDHFFPKELDASADFIYSWENYVWACHSCNNKKRSHYPLINPCDNAEVSEIYFHSLDGRYLVKQLASPQIKDKFDLTQRHTFINGKKCPERRYLINKQLVNIYLPKIITLHQCYDLEDPNSQTALQLLSKIEDAKNDLKEFFKAGEFMFLKIKIFNDFKVTEPSFIYHYSDFV